MYRSTMMQTTRLKLFYYFVVCLSRFVKDTKKTKEQEGEEETQFGAGERS